MIYNYILFQIKVDDTYYLGKFILNILNYSIYNYFNKESTFDNYIEKWFNLIYKDNFNENIKSNVLIILIEEKKEKIEKIHVDIIFNQENKSINFLNKEISLENYNKIYKEINNQFDIDFNVDYDDDELEIIIDKTLIYEKVEEGLNKYIHSKTGDYKKKYLKEIKELTEKEENKDKCLETILFEKFKKDYLEKYEYMLNEDFKNLKLQKINKKLEVLGHIINKYYKINKSLHNYCINKYCTQLFRKYKYTDDNLEKIKYNFVVMSFDIKKGEDEYSEINIYFESTKSNVKGEGEYKEGGNYRSGTFSKTTCYIEDNDYDNRKNLNNIGKDLINYVINSLKVEYLIKY